MKIFISYLRQDSQHQADRLHSILQRYINQLHDEIFIDVDSIPMGVDFASYLDGKVASADVVLALIGKDWVSATNPATGNKRLNDPNDFVRIEIASALRRGISVVPVMLDGADLPSVQDLPEDLRGLVSRNGTEIRRLTFEADVERLAKRLGLSALALPLTNQTSKAALQTSGPRRGGSTATALAVVIVSILGFGVYSWQSGIFAPPAVIEREANPAKPNEYGNSSRSVEPPASAVGVENASSKISGRSPCQTIASSGLPCSPEGLISALAMNSKPLIDQFLAAGLDGAVTVTDANWGSRPIWFRALVENAAGLKYLLDQMALKGKPLCKDAECEVFATVYPGLQMDQVCRIVAYDPMGMQSFRAKLQKAAVQEASELRKSWEVAVDKTLCTEDFRGSAAMGTFELLQSCQGNGFAVGPCHKRQCESAADSFRGNYPTSQAYVEQNSDELRRLLRFEDDMAICD